MGYTYKFQKALHDVKWWQMFTLILNQLCMQKFQVVQILSQLQRLMHTKLSVCKIINLKLYFVNIAILILTYSMEQRLS